MNSILQNLPELHKHFLNLLVKLGVEGNALAGTYLMMKDYPEDMEDFLLWMNDNQPNPEQIDEHLCQVVMKRQ